MDKGNVLLKIHRIFLIFSTFFLLLLFFFFRKSTSTHSQLKNIKFRITNQ